MSVTSGFYNSVSGDRLYTAEQLSNIFEGLISDGVYNQVGNALQVKATGDGMGIQVLPGRAWLRGTWIKNDAVHNMTLDLSEVALNRYDAVVLRSDSGDSVRNGGIYIKKGTPASTPAYPTMESGEFLKEIPLAYIYVGKNVTSITQANVTDMRGSASCPWVTGLITQVDTSTLWTQYKVQWAEFMSKEQADFLEWYNNLVDYLDADVETKLVNDVNTLKNQIKKSTGTFDGLGWSRQSDGTYTQTVTVQGVTADNDIMISPTAQYKDDYVNMGCEAIGQAANSITFRATSPEDVNMVISVIIFNLD